MKHAFKNLQIFDTLCDMHDGTRYLEFDTRHEVVNHQIIHVPNSTQIVELMLKNLNDGNRVAYVNKLLVVVEIDGNIIKAVYSYDNHSFGTVTIRITD